MPNMDYYYVQVYVREGDVADGWGVERAFE